MKKLMLFALFVLSLAVPAAAQEKNIRWHVSSLVLGAPGFGVSFDKLHRGSGVFEIAGAQVSVGSLDDGRILLGKAGISVTDQKGSVAFTASPVCIRIVNPRRNYSYSNSNWGDLYVAPTIWRALNQPGGRRRVQRSIGLQFSWAW